jgi:hypothetical protein
VQVLNDRGLDACAIVQNQPLLLLYHHVWFAGKGGQWDDAGAMQHDS